MTVKFSKVALQITLIVVMLFSVLLIVAQSSTSGEPINSDDLINTGNGRWVWEHPQPQGNNLAVVSCPTEYVCYAGGNVGYFSDEAFIIQTQDAAKTWTGRNVDGYGINDLFCNTSDLCYAASYDGQVLKSLNGGQDWQVQNTNTAEHLKGITCIDPENCIVVGDKGAIEYTTTGGQIWSASSGFNTYKNIKDVICVGSIYCLAVGGSGAMGAGNGIILRSQNSGKSWEIVTNSADNVFNAVSCFNTQTCVSVGWEGIIYVSADQGINWVKVSAHKSTYFNDIECPSTDKCFITSDDGNIFYSSNGYIWLKVNTQNTVPLWKISCSSTNRCVITGQNGILLTTATGGRNWTRLNYGELTTKAIQYCFENNCGRQYNNWINAIECFDDGRCLTIGDTGLILFGDILKHTWEANYLNTNENLFGLSCVKNQMGAICYTVSDKGGVWKSLDGGKNWQVKPTGITDHLFDIDCIDKNTCFAVGANGRIIRSTDGGVNWTILSSQTNSDLQAIECPSNSKCYAVGYNPAEIIYTNDSGETWLTPAQAQLDAPYTSLYDIYCKSTFSCLALGNIFGQTHTLVTNDGGVNWSLSPTISGYGYISIVCTLGNTCLSAGIRGEIHRSEDGGKTWQSESSGTFVTFRDAWCFEGGSCIVVGSDGAVLSSLTWPNLDINQYYWSDSVVDGQSITGTIQITNQGPTIARQINISHSLPSMLNSTRPLSVSWENENQTIISPTWPNILAGLPISLTPGSELSIQIPLTISNPFNQLQSGESKLTLQSDDLLQPIVDNVIVTFAQHHLYLPIISKSISPLPQGGCFGPYNDNFNSPSSSWPKGDTGNTVYNYDNGEYSILHRNANQWFAVSRGDYWQGDHFVTVDGYQAAREGVWGLWFGRTNDGFYTFEIVPDSQQWFIYHFTNANGWSLIASNGVNGIKPGSSKNNLLIQGVDGKMYFYINNVQVYEMNEVEGYIGLTGGSFRGNTEIRYDDYSFQQNECSVVGRLQANQHLLSFSSEIHSYDE